MSEAAHSQRAHALLSASGADRWINCPPSARLTADEPERRSEYADQGTLAHELAEIKLRRRLTVCDDKERKRLDRVEFLKIKANPMYDTEMENTIQEYVERVEERFIAARAITPDAVILLEERLDFSEWVPDGYGTGDVVIIADDLIEILDLKYGKGIEVSAHDNPQMRLYGLGAWTAYGYLYDIQTIRMTIIQPRLDSISSCDMPLADLLDWAETVARPAAALAYDGKGEFNAGKWCKWCKVKATCRARSEANMLALQYEFKEPPLLSFDEIGSILYVAEQLKAWAKDVEEYAYQQALLGNLVPQWKLVEGRSNRKITDEGAAIAALIHANVPHAKFYKPQELFGITELEKQIGKKDLALHLAGLIDKPQGKPVLVPESDKRPAFNSVAQDFANINMEE